MLKRLFDKYSSLRYVLSSAAAWAVDNGLYYLMLHFGLFGMGTMGAVQASTEAQLIARVVSSFFNFNCNKFFVFKEKGNYGPSLLKYYMLCIPQAAISVVLLDVVIANMTTHNDLLQTGLKIVIEGILFVISYFIQNKWVFKSH